MIVTHDRADADAFAGEVVVVEDGAVSQRGALADVATAPVTEFGRRFFGG